MKLTCLALLVALAGLASVQAVPGRWASFPSRRMMLAAAGPEGLADEALRALNGSLDGALLLRGAPGYGEAQELVESINSVYGPQRKPAVIVRAASVEDVQAAVRLAAEQKAPLCIKAGGHDSTGANLCDGGILIDVTPMKEVAVDRGALEATLQAGARWKDVVAAYDAAGVDGVMGICPTVGAAGFTLGGGWGYWTKTKGVGVDNVLGFTVVLADGSVVTANATSEPDLFWALRGGGHGTLGVVTDITYKVFPKVQGPEGFPAFNASWDVSKSTAQAAKVMHALQELFLDKEPDLTVVPDMFIDRTPDNEYAELDIYLVLHDPTPAGRDRLKKLMQPLLDLKPKDHLFYDVKKASDAEGVGAYDKPEGVLGKGDWAVKRGEFASGPLTEEQYKTMLDVWASWPKYPKSYKGRAIHGHYLEYFDGVVSKVPANATAFVHRNSPFTIVMETTFDQDPKLRQLALDWLKESYDKLAAAGLLNGQTYQNYPSDAYTPEEALQKYYGDNLCRLVEVKAAYDPTDLFHPVHGALPLSLPQCGGTAAAPAPAPAVAAAA